MPPIILTRSSLPSFLGLVLAAAACDPGVSAPEEQRVAADAAGPAVPESLDDLGAARPDHDDDAVECRGVQSAPRLSLESSVVRERDVILAGRDRALRVVVRNVHEGPLAVEPRLTWRFAGGVEREVLPRFELAAGEARELAIALDRRYDTATHPASLDVLMRTWHGRKRGVDEALPTAFFHADPASGELHVYDHEGMVARHRAGDLRGDHRAVDTRADLEGVGIAHLARPDELSGDPTDTRDARGESR